MKLPSLVTAGAIALSSFTTFSQPSQAQNAAARGFFGDTSSGGRTSVCCWFSHVPTW